MDKAGLIVLTQWNPFLARKSFICSEGALAVRVKSYNVINSPKGINAAITILRMFLTAKLKNRVTNDFLLFHKLKVTTSFFIR